VCLQRVVAVFSLHSSIWPRLREIQAHLLSEEVEALEVVDRVLRAVHIVVDDERLSLALQALLCDDLDNGAELVEKSMERLDQGGDFDAFVEVADLLGLS
jgi:galactokinase